MTLHDTDATRTHPGALTIITEALDGNKVKMDHQSSSFATPGVPLMVMGSSQTVWWGNEETVRNLRTNQRAVGIEITHVVNTVGAQGNAVALSPDERLPDVEYIDLNMVDEAGMTDDEVVKEGSMVWLTEVPGRPELEDSIAIIKSVNGDVYGVETHKVRERLDVTGRCVLNMWQANKRAVARAVAFIHAALGEGGCVLVNCQAGQNRSGAVLFAWLLIHQRGFSMSGATAYLRSIKEGALANGSLKRIAEELADEAAGAAREMAQPLAVAAVSVPLWECWEQLWKALGAWAVGFCARRGTGAPPLIVEQESGEIEPLF